MVRYVKVSGPNCAKCGNPDTVKFMALTGEWLCAKCLKRLREFPSGWK